MKKPRICGGLADVEDTKRNKIMHFEVGESLYKWPIQQFSGTKRNILASRNSEDFCLLKVNYKSALKRNRIVQVPFLWR